MKTFALGFLMLSTMATAADIPNLALVEPGLYRSGVLDESNIEMVSLLGIKTIISFKTNVFDNIFEKSWARENNVEWIHYPMLLIPEYDEPTVMRAVRTLKLRKNTALVHCTRGSDRTGVVVASYRLLINHWTYSATIDELQHYGFSPVFGVWRRFLREVAKCAPTGCGYDFD